MHIDVLGVAAAGWQLDREQHGGLRWARVVGMIGVEGLTRDDALAVHDLVVGDGVDVGVAGDVVLLLIVRLQLVEHLSGGFELVR